MRCQLSPCIIQFSFFYLASLQLMILILLLVGAISASSTAPHSCSMHVREACESSPRCHWDEQTCVNSLPCALETSRRSCEVNTWGCRWDESKGSCSKQLHAGQPRYGRDCTLHQNMVSCERVKSCRWVETSRSCMIRPTIVISLADDLGYYDVSWKNPRARTPVLETLRRFGVDLDRHYASRFCAPSRGMLLAGVLPWKNGLQTDSNLNPVNNIRCATSKDKKLIPQVLKQAGDYSTHAFGKWHLGNYGDDVIPTGRGFDTYLGFYGGGIMRHQKPGQFQSTRCACQTKRRRQRRRRRRRKGTSRAYDVRGVCSRSRLNFCTSAQNMVQATRGDKYETIINPQTVQEPATDLYLARKAQEMIHQLDSNVPAFFYMSWSAPHDPYYAPERFKTSLLKSTPAHGRDAKLNFAGRSCPAKSFRVEYLAMVSMLDEANRIVIDALESVDRFENTIYVFASDNGGHLPRRNKKGQILQCFTGFNYPLRGSKYSFWEGGIRVLSFVSSKLWIPPHMQGTSSKALSSLVDWRRTLVSASGSSMVVDDDDGHDLWPQLTGLGVNNATNVRTELCIQNWVERRRSVILFVFDNSLWKAIWGDPSSGIGNGDYRRSVPRYSRGEIEQPPELPNDQVTFPVHSGYFNYAHCPKGCLFNLDQDPQELRESKVVAAAWNRALQLRSKYFGQAVRVQDSGLCERGFYHTQSEFTTDRYSIERARNCGGYISWLDWQGNPKLVCS